MINQLVSIQSEATIALILGKLSKLFMIMMRISLKKQGDDAKVSKQNTT